MAIYTTSLKNDWCTGSDTYMTTGDYDPYETIYNGTATTYSYPRINNTVTNWDTSYKLVGTWDVPQIKYSTSEYITGGYVWPGEVTGGYLDLKNYISWPIIENSVPSKNSQFLEKIKSNLVIKIKSRANPSAMVNSAEKVAMETLREIISETDFRKYLRYGFVLVKGQSGAIYQVFRNKSHTRVWLNGKVVEEICVRIKDSNIPPTDNVIAFRQIIQTSESEFRKLGNVYNMRQAA